jgi:undecaprenyl-diphosphatase
MHFHILGWDLTLFAWINQGMQNGPFDALMPLFSDEAALWAACIGLAVIGLWSRRVTVTVVLGMTLCIGASDLVCNQIKDAAGRVRPYQSLAGARYQDSGVWKTRPADFAAAKRTGSSFPSSHTSNAAAATLFLYAGWRRKALWLVPLAIGFSRVYVGKHFPTDVLAGGAVGLAVGGAVLLIYPSLCDRIRSRWMRYRLRM